MKKIFAVKGGRFFPWSIILLIILVSCGNQAQSQQEIPTGQWRMHLSYNKVISIAVSGNAAYGATEMGIVVFDKEDQSMSTLNRLNGLSSSGITNIAYDTQTNHLIVTYEDGNVDLIKDDEVYNFTRLRDLSSVSTSKRINHISFRNKLAYLSTGYGVVVFDLQKREVKETWRDLGLNGEQLSVNATTFKGDSIFAATNVGIISGSLTDNLLYFSKWKRYATGDLNNEVQSITVFDDRVYAIVSTKGLYKLSGSVFSKEPVLKNEILNSLDASSNDLLITTNNSLWMLSKSGQLVQVADDAITLPIHAKKDDTGTVWIADANNGLVSNVSGTFESYVPNGPNFNTAFRLRYLNGKLYVVSGGFTTAGLPTGKPGVANYFENGLWKSETFNATDLTDVELFQNNFFIGSFSEGLLQTNLNGNVTIFDSSNSPLEDVGGNGTFISSLTTSDAGLWVVNYGATQPLQLLKTDNTWQSFSIPFSSASYTTKAISDLNGNIWMAVNANRGGGLIVFDPVTSQAKYLTETPGSGALPSQIVRSLAADREGNVWVGTDAGVAYFFSPGEDAVKPIYENRFLLKDEKITAIKVDGGNRKWLGTERGVWLFDALGENQIANFTSENSPLLSNSINDIEINGETGEVFFSTDKGIISFRADATSSNSTFQKLKIFPNPVTRQFSGEVGITGLATDAIVKITDSSGKLIRQMQANGGTATWDVRDHRGKRAATGVYVVFATTADGSERTVGKIAVID